MKIILPLIALLLFCSPIFSQTILCPENPEIDSLIDKAIEAANDGKTEIAIADFKKGISISKSVRCLKGEMVCNKNLMIIYQRLAEYEKTLEISKETEKLALQLKDYRNLCTVQETKAYIYNVSGLYKESIRQYESALKYAAMIKEPDYRYYELGYIYYNLAPAYQDISLEQSGEYLLKAKNEVEKINDNSSQISLTKKISMRISINVNLGILYKISKEPEDMRIAESYFTAALNDAENENYEIYEDTKVSMYQALAEFYNTKEEYDKAVFYGEKMLKLEKETYSIPYERKLVYMQLAKSYLGMGNNEASQKYLKLYTSLNDSLFVAERKNTMTPAKQIISDRDKENQKKIKNLLISGGILFVFLAAIGGFLWVRNKQKLKNEYEKLIEKLKTESYADASDISETKEKQDEIESISNDETIESENEINSKEKSLQITENTVKTILGRLERFEKSDKYLKKEINLTYLATQVGTNTKYLSEIIKQHKEKSFSSYINGLRINYIATLLYKEPKYREYKISYLAEMCGFSSREVFAVVFKKETGVSPSYYIDNLKNDNSIN